MVKKLDGGLSCQRYFFEVHICAGPVSFATTSMMRRNIGFPLVNIAIPATGSAGPIGILNAGDSDASGNGNAQLGRVMPGSDEDDIDKLR